MNFDRFRRRVKGLRAVRGGLLGLGVAGLLALAYAITFALWDRLPQWPVLLGLAAAGALLGAIFGFFRRLSNADLAASIDRRAGLQDRLTTAGEVDSERPFGTELHADAQTAIRNVEAKSVFPTTWRWRDALAAAPMLSSVVLVWLLLLPPRLSPEEQSLREKMANKEAEIERVLAPIEERARQGKATDAEIRLVNEIQKLRRDLRDVRSNPEKVLESTNDLHQKAEQAATFRSEQTLASLAKAEQSNARLAMQALEKESKLSPDELAAIQRQLDEQAKRQRDLAQKKSDLRKQIDEIDRRLQDENLSQSQRESLERKRAQLTEDLSQTQAQADAQARLSEADAAELQAQQEALQSEVASKQRQMAQAQEQAKQLKEGLKDAKLSPEDRARMEKQLKQLEDLQRRLGKELDELRARMNEIANLKSVREMMERINNHPAMKELLEMAQKLQQNAQQTQQDAEAPQLTKEQIQEMIDRMDEIQQQLEELAERLQDPEELEAFMEALRDALENAEMQSDAASLCLCLGLGLTPGMGMGIALNTTPSGGPGGYDVMGRDTGQVNKSDRDKGIKDKPIPTQVRGQRRQEGSEAFIEVRGPTGVGNRTSVPYSRVLPSYRQRAERAAANQTIPKQHERRVKRYFESLGGTR